MMKIVLAITIIFLSMQTTRADNSIPQEYVKLQCGYIRNKTDEQKCQNKWNYRQKIITKYKLPVDLVDRYCDFRMKKESTCVEKVKKEIERIAKKNTPKPKYKILHFKSQEEIDIAEQKELEELSDIKHYTNLDNIQSNSFQKNMFQMCKDYIESDRAASYGVRWLPGEKIEFVESTSNARREIAESQFDSVNEAAQKIIEASDTHMSIELWGDKLQLRNAFGIWQRITYKCTMETPRTNEEHKNWEPSVSVDFSAGTL